MRTISSIEMNGSTFTFEPPVPIRDDERALMTLAKVATYAWYGTEFPYGIGHDLAEGGFEQLIEDNALDPQMIASRLTDSLQTQTPYTVKLVTP